MLHAGAPGDMDMVLHAGAQLPLFRQNLSPQNAAVHTQGEASLLR